MYDLDLGHVLLADRLADAEYARLLRANPDRVVPTRLGRLGRRLLRTVRHRPAPRRAGVVECPATAGC